MHTITLTQSAIKNFQSCQQKYKLSYVDLLTTESKPLYFLQGSAWHECLESYSRFFDIDLAEKTIFSYCNEHIANESERKASIYMLLEMLCGYIDEYHDDEFETIETEKRFKIDIQNPDTGEIDSYFIFEGIIDALVRDEQGALWIKEIKTTKSITEKYKNGLKYDMQPLAYYVAMLVSGYNVKGVLHDAAAKDPPNKPKILSNGSLSRDKSQNTSEKLYMQAIIEMGLDPGDYTKELEAFRTKGKEWFYRVQLCFSDQQVLQFKRDLWEIKEQIKRKINLSGNWPYNRQQCNQMSICQYEPICTSQMPQEITERFYVKKESPHMELFEHDKKLEMEDF